MDIYEIYNTAKDNLKIKVSGTEKEIHDGDYFNLIVEISNPKRSIFSFLEEPSYTYDDLTLKVEETPYTRPTDKAFADGLKIDRPVNPNEKIAMRIPLEAKMDLPPNLPPDAYLKVIVEAHLKTDDLFSFDKSNSGGPSVQRPT
jgi:hypothetical protein